jgi:hypothetical protein
MYQVRYPLQAAEARAQSLWSGRVWKVPEAETIQDAVLRDVRARLYGEESVPGTTSLSGLGVLTPSRVPMPTNLFQGADAFRLACILSQKTQTCPPASCWRLVHEIAHKLSGSDPFMPDVITMYIRQNPEEAGIVKALKNSDFYQALSLVRSGLTRPLSAPQKSFYLAVLYPMVPHVACFILPSVDKQASSFYRWLGAQPLPLPVLVNHRRCGWWWPEGNPSDKQVEKEVLSLPAVSNKIKGKSVQRIIYKEGRVVHVLV